MNTFFAIRKEPWGAWVRSDDGAYLIALRKKNASYTFFSQPLEVHLAVTERCYAACPSCYMGANPRGFQPSLSDLKKRLSEIAKQGAFTVAFGGGEPIVRSDLGVLATFARELGLTPVLTTSGLGLTPKKCEELKSFAQVNVSFDSLDEDYIKIRSYDGSNIAEKAISNLSKRGVRVGINVVLTQINWHKLTTITCRAKELGAREVQLLRYKPQGRALQLNYQTLTPTKSMIDTFALKLKELVSHHRGLFSVRIDCALVPFLSTDENISCEELSRYGVFGCEAGRYLRAVGVDGVSSPCSFVSQKTHAAHALQAETQEYLHGVSDQDFLHFRTNPPPPCASCSIFLVCFGGCKVVARGMVADPECPKVRAWNVGRSL